MVMWLAWFKNKQLDKAYAQILRMKEKNWDRRMQGNSLIVWVVAVIDGEEIDMIHQPQMKEYFIAIVK